MLKIVLNCIILYFVLGSSNAEICNLPKNGGLGKCVPINDCPKLADLQQRSQGHPLVARLLRSLTCGSVNDNTNQLVIPKVCCSDCYTPEGKEGTCIPIQECPGLMNLATTNLNYVRNSMCQTGEFDVCCGPVPDAPVKGSCQTQVTAFPPDPATDCCGIEANAESRIVGGKSTAIDQYPWLVLLEYEMNNKISLLCGGSLISNKYVLTAAHCVPDHKKPTKVRVGEYDIFNEGEDCVSTPGGGKDCTDPAVSIPIKKIIKHAEYNASLHRHDIALIELDGVVNYTDFVRPICLPSADVSELQPYSNLKLYVAGWGKIAWNIKNSRLKQHLKVPMVEMQECQNRYFNSLVQPKPQLWSLQLCAGGEQGRDSCNGDSGGPLMMTSTRADSMDVHTLEGIVSYGPKKCGTKGIPGVYTKVYEYNTWIRSNIKP